MAKVMFSLSVFPFIDTRGGGEFFRIQYLWGDFQGFTGGGGSILFHLHRVGEEQIL